MMTWRVRNAVLTSPCSRHHAPRRRYDFFSDSSAAAGLLYDAQAAGDTEATRVARAVCERVWQRWKLQPADLPLPLAPGERYRVLRDRGITLINLAVDDQPAHAPPAQPSGAPSRRSADGPRLQSVSHCPRDRAEPRRGHRCRETSLWRQPRRPMVRRDGTAQASRTVGERMRAKLAVAP